MDKTKLTLILILIVAAILRVPLVAQGFFSFAIDQGSDLLAVKKIVIDHNLTLIGPQTGLPGVFYGPWWYYFLSPIFFFAGGNPKTVTLVFGLIGIAVVIAIYLLIKKLTSNSQVALFAAATVSISQIFITSSSQVWSPSLIPPLMLLYMFSVFKIIHGSSKLWFLILGAATGFIIDSETAFGTMLFLATPLALISSQKISKDFWLFIRRKTLFILGLFIVFLPRIIFDIRNDFLITKSILSWLSSPTVYQQHLSFFERILNRIDLFFNNFAQAFSQSNKVLALPTLILLITSIYSARAKLIKDDLFKYLIMVILGIFIGFSIYPDTVWDYYLGGLPIIFLATLTLSLKYFLKKLKKPLVVFLFFSLPLAANFNSRLFSPFSINWQGDGAVFRNQINVIESLKNDLKGNYSLFVYTPAMFDYPFDYLIWWYHHKKQIDLPKENQKRMFLIIRDDQSHLYLPTGWYGDKVKNNTIMLSRRIFTGNIIVEEHQVK